MAKITVEDGEILEDQNISSGDRLYVNAGGTAKGTSILSGGEAYVYESGFLIDTSVQDTGKVNVIGGEVSGTTTITGESAQKYALLAISSGGTIDTATVQNYGKLTLHDKDSYAQSVVLESEGNATVYGGTMNGTIINNGGTQLVTSLKDETGYAINTTVNDGGVQNVQNQGIAAYTDLTDGGSQILKTGGTAVNTYAYSGSTITVNNGGILQGSYIYAQAELTIKNGGILSQESTQIFDGGTVKLEKGAILDSALSVQGEVYVAGDFSCTEEKGNGLFICVQGHDQSVAQLHGLENMTDTSHVFITVTSDITSGTYILADNVSEDYDGWLGIWNNSWCTEGLSIQVNGDSVQSDGLKYTLKNIDGTLSVTVDNNADQFILLNKFSSYVAYSSFNLSYDGWYSFEEMIDSTFSGTLEICALDDTVIKRINVRGDILDENNTLLDAGSYLLKITSNTSELTGNEIAHLVGTDVFYHANQAYDDDWQTLVEPVTRTYIAAENSKTLDDQRIADYKGNLEFVGYHDLVDYRQFTLENDAYGDISFFIDDPTLEKSVKVTLYAISGTKLSQIKSLTVNSTDNTIVSDTYFKAGTYYLKTESINGNSGTSTDYAATFSAYLFAAAKEGRGAALTTETQLVSGESVSGEVSNSVATEYFRLNINTNGLYSLSFENDISRSFGTKQSVTITVWSMPSGKNALSKVTSFSVCENDWDSQSFFLSSGNYFVSVALQDTKSVKDIFYSLTSNTVDLYKPSGNTVANFMNAVSPVILAEDSSICEDLYSGYGSPVQWIALSASSSDPEKLITGGNYNFTIENTGNGTASVGLYQLVNGKSVKKIKSVSVASGAAAVINGQSLSSDSVYFFQVDGSAAEKAKTYAEISIETSAANDYTPINADDLVEDLDDVYKAEKPATGNKTILCTDEFIGDGDAVDYRMLTLSQDGYYAFTLSSDVRNTDLVLTVWTPSPDGTKLKKVQSKTGSSVSLATQLDAGTYYVSVASAKSKTAGLYADYELYVNTVNVTEGKDDHFFANLSDEFCATLAPETVSEPAAAVQLDMDGSIDAGNASCRKITVAEDGYYTITLSADAGTSYKLYTLTAGTNTLKQVSGVSLTGADKKNTKNVFLAAGIYYGIAVNSKEDDDYSVSLEGSAYTDQDNSDDLPLFTDDTFRIIYRGETVSLFGENFVGYGDSIDWRMFTTGTAGTYTFEPSSDGTNPVTVSVYTMNDSGTALKKVAGGTNDLTLKLAADTCYFVSASCAKASSGMYSCYEVSVSGPEEIQDAEISNDSSYATLTNDFYISAAEPEKNSRSFEDQDIIADQSLAAKESVFRAYVVDTDGYYTFDLEGPAKSALTLYTLKSDGTSLTKKTSSSTGFSTWLQTGTYYLGVNSPNDGTISVTASGTVYTDPNLTDDDCYGLPDEYQFTVAEEGTTTLFANEFLGSYDAVDSRKLTLTHDGYYNLELISDNRTANLTATIWKWNATGSALSKAGTITLSASAKTDSASMKSDLLLTAGEYYITTEAANTSKGTFAEYELSVNAVTVFDSKDISSEDDSFAGARSLTDSGIKNCYVGCSDSVDCFQLEGYATGEYSFTAQVTDGDSDIKFTLYYYNESKGTMIALASLKQEGTTSSIYLESDKKYFCMVQASNTKQGADYEISVESSVSKHLEISVDQSASVNLVAEPDALVNFEIGSDASGWNCCFDKSTLGDMTLWKMDDSKGTLSQVKFSYDADMPLAEGNYCLKMDPTYAAVGENTVVSFDADSRTFDWKTLA